MRHSYQRNRVSST
ncbi:hypothetical protein GQ600_21871 [Phytophthora cactorum]|nr:hypothetical protein GQ600_21871 [Phytophthora cactorum]